MHRTIGDSFGLDGSNHIFRQESPGTYDATQGTFDTMNALQEEIANVIEAEGFSLNPSSETIAQMIQLNAAIDKKVADEATIRDANDKAADGELARKHINDVNTVAGQTELLDSILKISEGYLHGMNITRNNTTKSLLEVWPGVAVSYNGDAVLRNTTSPFTKKATTSRVWANGTGAVGIPSGVGAKIAGDWLHLFAIIRSDGNFDVGFDDSPTAANLQAGGADPGATAWRRIGGGEIETVNGPDLEFYEMVQIGEFVQLDGPVSGVAISADLNATTLVLEPVPAPRNVSNQITHVFGVFEMGVNNGWAAVVPAAGWSATAWTAGSPPAYDVERDGSGGHIFRATYKVMPAGSTSTAANLFKLRIVCNNVASQTLALRYFGYFDRRGVAIPEAYLT